MSEHTIVILVVDDEHDDRRRMAETLRKAGYDILQAVDSTQALQIVQTQPRQIDLLLTDISLPGINGCELAKRLLKHYPELRVLFVSGYVGGEMCRYYGIPTTDLFFLRKPFETDVLLTRVRQVLASEERVALTPANGETEPRRNSAR